MSFFKLAVFLALFVPGIWISLRYAAGAIGPRPLNEAIREFGLWTLRFLFLALAVTPLRQIFSSPRLASLRRMIGLAAFSYAAVHFLFYNADQSFKILKVGGEIFSRLYLLIGFVALCGLTTLAATSTDGMVRRLGARSWQRLHRLVYALAVLGVVHFFMQSKLYVWEPMVMAGLLLWLLGYRLLARLSPQRGGVPLTWLCALSLFAGIATAIGEAAYFAFKTGANGWRVFGVEFSLAAGLRPAPVVLAVGLGICALAALSVFLSRPRTRGPRFLSTSPSPLRQKPAA